MCLFMYLMSFSGATLLPCTSFCLLNSSLLIQTFQGSRGARQRRIMARNECNMFPYQTTWGQHNKNSFIFENRWDQPSNETISWLLGVVWIIRIIYKTIKVGWWLVDTDNCFISNTDLETEPMRSCCEPGQDQHCSKGILKTEGWMAEPKK